jgi:hypothetical protein
MNQLGAYGPILAGALIVGVLGVVVSIIEQKRRRSR